MSCTLVWLNGLHTTHAGISRHRDIIDILVCVLTSLVPCSGNARANDKVYPNPTLQFIITQQILRKCVETNHHKDTNSS